MGPFTKGLLMIFLLHCSNAMRAQQVLSLHQALDSMQKNYPSLQIKQSLIQAAEAYTHQVAHERVPSLKLMEQFDAGTNNGITGSIFPSGIVPSVNGGRRDANVSEMQYGNVTIGFLDWELINFGSYKARDEAAAANVTLQRSDFERERFLMQGAVLSTYNDVLKNYYLVQYSHRAVERIDTIRRAIAFFALNGLRPGVDSSVASAELSKARLISLEAERNLAQSKNQLALVTGVDTALITPDTENAFVPESMAKLNSAHDSLYYHPLLQYYQSEYRYNLANENAIRKNYRPKVSLLASTWLRGSTIDPQDNFHHPVTSAFTQNRYNYLAGLSLTWNPFDLYKKHDQLAVQQYRTQASQQQYNLQQQQLQTAIQQADVNVSTALQKLHEIPVQLKAATDAYNQRLALYHEGLTNIIDVVNAYYVLNRAETDLVLAQDEYRKAIFQKAYARNQVGQLLSLLK